MTLANQAISRFANAPNVLAKSPVPAHAYLTPRESLILADVVEGHSSKEIARAVGILGDASARIAKRGLQIPMPASDSLFVEPGIYETGLLDELSVNAYWAVVIGKASTPV